MKHEVKQGLQELVDRYQVCWFVFPHDEMVDGERVQTGFEIELDGTHSHGATRAVPGCDRCIEVYDALQVIALNIVPDERRPSMYLLSPFDQSIRYSHMHHDRPDVILAVTIRHRNGFGPVDSCELRCLEEIKQNLIDIGAGHRSWSPRDKAA